MNTDEWKHRIVTAIAREGSNPEEADRLGRTPVIVLAADIRHQHTGDRALIDVAGMLLTTPFGDAPERLIMLLRLINSAKLHHSDIATAVYRRLKSGKPNDLKARILLINTLLNMEFQLSAADLEAVTDIRDAAPVRWINAWIKSGYVKKGLSFAEACIREGKIGSLELQRSIGSWWKKIGPVSEKPIQDWYALLRDDPHRELLGKWMDMKGIPRQDQKPFRGEGKTRQQRPWRVKHPVASLKRQAAAGSSEVKPFRAEGEGLWLAIYPLDQEGRNWRIHVNLSESNKKMLSSGESVYLQDTDGLVWLYGTPDEEGVLAVDVDWEHYGSPLRRLHDYKVELFPFHPLEFSGRESFG